MDAIYEFDYSVLNAIQEITNPFLDKFMGFVTHFGDGGIFWICFAALLLCFKRTRKAGFCMGVALALGSICANLILKPGVNRIRPWNNTEYMHLIKVTVEDILQKTSHVPGDGSFPSGHSMASAEASVALFLCNKKLGTPAIILAACVAASRLYLYIHYPTDVIAAVILGIGFAFAGYYTVKWFTEKHWPKVKHRFAKKEQIS